MNKKNFFREQTRYDILYSSLTRDYNKLLYMVYIHFLFYPCKSIFSTDDYR